MGIWAELLILYTACKDVACYVITANRDDG